MQFPPPPLSERQQASIVKEWCQAISSDSLMEAPCAICARLTPIKDLHHVSDVSVDLSCLERPGEGITRKERANVTDPILEIPGPILYEPAVRTIDGHRHFSACAPCLNVVKRHKVPKYALANGRWIGECPPQLQGLTYVEQLLIARQRHSFCVAQVSSGQRFLAANVIVFGQPVARLLDVLPPPKKEIEECLAILFVGSAKPTDEDIRRTPFLWLQLNSVAYHDVRISHENLATYTDNEPPVGIIYRRTSSTAPDESLAVYESVNERGVDNGECLFTVHGLSSSEFRRPCARLWTRSDSSKHLPQS
ncbi:hypothetical protein OH76DRAFT_1452215 [Lentinus brumalis]|uniref:DUF6570 domain-containing protein n=1 Tax=Lentinus brumalis TaxID=2498619 RepID=A0A371DUG2_9APHY|nr:hypothetical protein OH76DRAFT_1452215 [Polyporus brumalis]